MDLINSLVNQIPTGQGYMVAFLVIALFVYKEMRRAWNVPSTPRRADDPVQAPNRAAERKRRSLENGLISLLFGLYGLILLVRLLSFFP